MKHMVSSWTILTPRIDNNDPKLCNSSLSTGCLRCNPQSPPDTCCDLCFPDTFADNTMNNITNTRPTRSGPSRIKAFESTDHHRNLRTALIAWREQAALQKHGKMVIRRYGSQILMSERILDRLVLCAQAHKISTVGCIKREIQWKANLADTYGAAIVSLLHEHFPLPSTSSVTRLPPTKASNGETNTTGSVVEDSNKVPTKRTCSACGQQGHIRTYLVLSCGPLYLLALL